MRRRVQQQPAYVLHTRAFSETSVIADVMTKHHGRLAMIAKGAKRLKSPLRGVLQPFQPLRIGFSGKGELQTLTAAEFDGRLRPLTGKRLYCGFYLSELVLSLTHRHDPIEDVFIHYADAVRQLADAGCDLEAVLRRFEVNLLAALGYGLLLEHEAGSRRNAIGEDALYDYVPDLGPVRRPSSTTRQSLGHDLTVVGGGGVDENLISVHGATLTALKSGDVSSHRVRRESKRLLRVELQRRLEGKTLKTRQLLHSLSNLQRPATIEPGSQTQAS